MIKVLDLIRRIIYEIFFKKKEIYFIFSPFRKFNIFLLCKYKNYFIDIVKHLFPSIFLLYFSLSFTESTLVVSKIQITLIYMI